MIHISSTHHDHKWLNQQISHYLDEYDFTTKEEESIEHLILAIAEGYQRTIDRQNWGLGWD